MIPSGNDHQGEQTLMTMRPTRYIAFHYYVLFLVSLILAPLVYLHPWYFDLIPRATIGPIDTNLILLALLLILALYSLIRAELKRATTFFVITDNKIIRKDGILNKNTQMVPYTQLERIDLNQTFGQRILHIGTVVVDTGDDTLKIDHISHPEKVQQLLSARLGRRSYVIQR
jgi:membrane protein YdbS with pleckstrin-like domain